MQRQDVEIEKTKIGYMGATCNLLSMSKKYWHSYPSWRLQFNSIHGQLIAHKDQLLWMRTHILQTPKDTSIQVSVVLSEHCDLTGGMHLLQLCIFLSYIHGGILFPQLCEGISLAGSGATSSGHAFKK